MSDRPLSEQQERTNLLQRVRSAASAQLGSALDRWFAGDTSTVKVDGRRGVWVSVAEDEINSFEWETEFKSYEGSNHMFADLLVPAKLHTPFIVHLSHANEPGARLTFVAKPEIPIISLGKPYSFAEIVGAVCYVLAKQKVVVVSPYFRGEIKKRGLNPDDESFACIVPLPPELAGRLRRYKAKPVRAVLVETTYLNLDAIADELEIPVETRATIHCSRQGEFSCSFGGVNTSNAAPLSGVADYLHAKGIRAVLARVRSWDDEGWRKLPRNTFDNIETLFVLAESDAASLISNMEAFAGFDRL